MCIFCSEEAMVELSQRLSLQQILAPHQLLSLKVLQLPTLELEQVIRQELEANPLLEVVEPEPEGPSQSEELQEHTDEEVDWEAILWDGFELMGVPHEREEREEDRRPEYSAQVNLGEYLRSQLRLLLSDPKDLEIGEAIIGSIDGAGYLCCPVEEIAKAIEVPSEEVERVLRIVQTLDPPGIGARDVREGLMLQLKNMGLEDSLAMCIVKDHLEDFTARRYGKLCRELDVTEEELREAEQIISRLNPRPSSGNFGEEALPIVPDLIVEPRNGEYEVVVNDASVPSLRISPLYRSLLREKDLNDDVRQYILERLKSARWLLRAIRQRRTTMQRVMEAIVKAQRPFFDYGISYLKPLTLQQIADMVGLHPSTVSRVVSGKYVQTPHGLFPMKFFFSSGLGSSNGEVSAKGVMDRIRELVEGEDPHNPLSDDQISKKLKEEGIEVARRTVAKYREKLGIPAARFRRRL